MIGCARLLKRRIVVVGHDELNLTASNVARICKIFYKLWAVFQFINQLRKGLRVIFVRGDAAELHLTGLWLYSTVTRNTRSEVAWERPSPALARRQRLERAKIYTRFSSRI